MTLRAGVVGARRQQGAQIGLVEAVVLALPIDLQAGLLVPFAATGRPGQTLESPMRTEQALSHVEPIMAATPKVCEQAGRPAGVRLGAPPMNASERTVLIVGGGLAGLAGLACAIRLQEAGARPPSSREVTALVAGSEPIRCMGL